MSRWQVDGVQLIYKIAYDEEVYFRFVWRCAGGARFEFL